MEKKEVGESCAEKYNKITRLLIEKELTITTMESCTSGTIASLITDTEGSSAVMKGAFVTYSNEAKIMIGVPKEIISEYGVYSAETAEKMAAVAMEKYNADIAVGVTGSFANVDPANSDSQPNVVYFAIKFKDHVEARVFEGFQANGRKQAKLLVAEAVADRLLDLLAD